MYDLKDIAGCTEAIRSAISALNALLTALEPAEQEKQPETVKPVTMEELRTALAAKVTEGFGSEVRALIEKYGAKKLSDVDSAHYANLIAEVEVLSNAT